MNSPPFGKILLHVPCKMGGGCGEQTGPIDVWRAGNKKLETIAKNKKKNAF